MSLGSVGFIVNVGFPLFGAGMPGECCVVSSTWFYSCLDQLCTELSPSSKVCGPFYTGLSFSQEEICC